MKLPQLSLRDLFWLVALVAMGCGWWVDRWRLTRERDRIEVELMMVDAAGRDAMPWMISAAGLDKEAMAQFNKVWISYQTASPKKRAQMEQSAMVLLSGLKDLD